MKIFIIFLFLFNFTLSLSGNESFKEYLKMKSVAYEFYNYGDDKEAIKTINKFIDRYPKSKYGRNLLATLYYWQGDLSKSKSILHAILKDGEFAQSLSLLKKIESKESTSKKLQIDHKHDTITTDSEVQELFKYVKVKNRVSEALDIRKSAFEKLDDFYVNEKYNEFLNLYISLENSNILMPTYLNVNALYCSIKLKEYKKAKRILHIYKMPENRHLEELEKLVDKKLLENRFTSF